MKKLNIFSVFFVALALFMGVFFPQPALAIPGDYNEDGLVNNTDVAMLLNYLFLPGSPPPSNPIDMDVDGSPGINLGDVLQLIGYLYIGCELIPYTGVSVEVGSHIRISSTVIPPDTIAGTPITIPVKIIENGGPELKGMVIPLSYANDPNELEVTLDNVTFTGGIVPVDWNTGAKIDNDNKRVVFYAFDNIGSGSTIAVGDTGVIVELHFTRESLGPWPLVMSTTQVPPSHSIMLISAYCADTLGGTSPSERIFTPLLSLARKGDCNGDGKVNSADVIYLINYLFVEGPPPTGL